MTMRGGGDRRVRNIVQMARRIHLRLKQYRRRHPNRGPKIGDVLSRILLHDPTYIPTRPRTTAPRRPPLENPGVFTLQQIADSLGTTVGDLLGEPGHLSPLDFVTRDQRRTLLDAVAILRDLFDLDDPTL